MLDLDETLIYSSMKPIYAQDFVETIGSSIIFVKYRPYLMKFLTEMKTIYEIVLYTGGNKEYADAIIKHIENDQPIFDHVLYHDQCVSQQGEYLIKYLGMLKGNRRNEDIVVVDNSLLNFCNSICNLVPILEFNENAKNDDALIRLASYLKELLHEEDIRLRIKDDIASFLICKRIDYS